MKKIVTMLVAFGMLFSVVNLPAVQAAPTIKIYLNGSRLATDVAPIMVKNRTLLPLKTVFEALNASISWNQSTKTVTASRNGNEMVLKIGSKTAKLNNRNITLDVPAQVVKGRTLVPVRFASEAMGEKIDWNERTSSVYITTSSSNEGNNGNEPTDNGNYNEFTPVTNVTAELTGNRGDASDITVSFKKASNESSVSQYRVMAVKSDRANSFDLSKARTVSSSNYMTIYKDGKDQRVSITTGKRDVDGDVIKDNQAYVMYILTVGKNNEYGLSYQIPAITIGSNSSVLPVSSLQVADVNEYGDGRDLSVTFTRPQYDDNINSYRIMVVKSSEVYRFDLNTANAVSSQNYTTVYKNSGTLTTTLNSSSRDTSGELIRNGVSYTIYALSISNNTSTWANKLSTGSSITLGSSIGAPVITKVEDINNYGDGRDVQVSFNRSADESKISGYRVFAVKYRDAASFNLAEANKVSYGRYHDVSKTGYSSITAALSSSARDIYGSSIQNNESYQLFVMSLSKDNSSYNMLSAPSQVLTLTNNSNTNAPSYVTARDVSDYNDGRDMQVSFNRSADESNISHYRVMVAKSGYADRFNLAEANSVKSANYTTVNKTGSGLSINLSASARDVDGSLIQNGVSYRVFVLAIGNNSNNAALSTSSEVITLSGNSTLYAPTNVTALDIADYNDGRDMMVLFNRASDESNVNHYRIMVVKSGNASRFNLSDANDVRSSNYTVVNKTGSNLSVNLTASTRDVDGTTIKNGVSYRIFALAVGNSSYSNALSYGSDMITLGGGSAGYGSAATNVSAIDVADYNDGRDMTVLFNRATDESLISHYRIMVVKSSNASWFNVAEAAKVNGSNYVPVGKTGSNLNMNLPASARDVDGAPIKSGVSYRIFVFSAGFDNYSGNALSAASPDMMLSNHSSVTAVTNVVARPISANGTARDIEVNFLTPASEANVAEYRIFIVRSDQANSFTLNTANQIYEWGYTRVAKQGNYAFARQQLSDNTRDITGNVITAGVAYKAFVLTISDNRSNPVNALSAASAEIALLNQNGPAAVSNVLAVNDWNGASFKAYFDRTSSNNNVSYYKVMVVPTYMTASFNLDAANRAPYGFKIVGTTGDTFVTFSTSDLDVTGNAIRNGIAYKVYVLSVGDGRGSNVSGLSAPSNEIVL
ncbi:copper amine oxidase N-terminal domain-containing protein [Paenibacillus sp. UMB4589-SE434]|uniref:copper amine oxidase N-terminal domain-containing protein n=1 Tax=Paenibacillus sp. UMB4589-SE434 TaxID=3046314 RepID=UPI00254C4A4A|nr:copper amine oxidase N-terminal domain-containing protein [Paenibacillus sp. UMB4589-SE434]MDK8183502.1 copper amine oxidase N-terminal domain-containing protein [Paenibacillus sp. UMB4589-SE434]